MGVFSSAIVDQAFAAPFSPFDSSKISVQNQTNSLTPYLQPRKTTIYSPTNATGKKIVCIVFDDGLKDHLTVAFPIIEKYGFKATFAVITSFVEANTSNYMNWADITNLQNTGMDIESHSYSHVSLNRLDNQSLFREIAISKKALAEHNISANIFVYPYGQGSDNQTVRNIVKQWYLTARGILPNTLNLTNTDRYNLYAKEVFLGEPIATFKEKIKTTNSITILFYHNVNSSSVSAEGFDAQMHYLKDQNFTILTLKQAFLFSRLEYISPDNNGPLANWRFR